jgi:transcriptional regulator with XRE-family HTH domain
MLYSSPEEKELIIVSIGKRLKEARIMRKMTQEDLAAAAGVTKGAIGNYETEVSSPKEAILIKLMEVLQIDANYLYQDYIVQEDDDQQRLEALHQDPRLGLLFDRSRKMSHEDVEFMLQMADRILKERDGDD